MSSDIVGRGLSTAPEGYMSVAECIDRHVNRGFGLKGISAFEADQAWRNIRALLFKRKIRSVCVRKNSKIESIPHQYWISDEARKLVDALKNNHEPFLSGIVNGTPYISKLDFSVHVERLVYPLPSSQIPEDLVFVSYKVEDEIAMPSTYVSLTLAVHIYAENAKARDENYEIKDYNFGRNEIFDLIYNGKIRTFHINKKGLVRPLRQEDWSDEGPITLQVEHDGSLIDDTGRLVNGRPHLMSNLTIQTSSGPERGEIIIPNKDIFSAIANRSTIEKINRGRPKDYDRELFLIKAFEVMWMPPCVVPENREEHIQKAVDLYTLASNGSTPSKSWARPLINKIWNSMGLKGGEDPPS